LFCPSGTHSSLKGKVQKLKDKQFGRVSMFKPHSDNPPVVFDSPIRHYKAYSLSRAWMGETFYWGLAPQAGDAIVFNLQPPAPLTGFRFVSGNAEHPSDKLTDADVEAKFEEESAIPKDMRRSKDGFVVLAAFDENGVAEGTVRPEWGAVSAVRLSIHTGSDNWLIISEMHLQT